MTEQKPALQVSGLPGCLLFLVVLLGSLGGLVYIASLIWDALGD